MSGDYEELLRPKDVAKIFNISVKTLWEWQRKGFLELLAVYGCMRSLCDDAIP
ncbi:MAG: hypothetical protein QW128_08285 [Thermoprotei archaeon]